LEGTSRRLDPAGADHPDRAGGAEEGG
jgi:hypothetical protein